MAIVAIFWMGLAFLLSFERTNASERAFQQGSSLARLFEENTIRLFKGVDQTLLLLRLAYEENPERFDLRHWADGPDALPVLPRWALPDPGLRNAWGPSVLARGGHYLLYYTTKTKAGVECIGQ